MLKSNGPVGGVLFSEIYDYYSVSSFCRKMLSRLHLHFSHGFLYCRKCHFAMNSHEDHCVIYIVK